MNQELGLWTRISGTLHNKLFYLKPYCDYGKEEKDYNNILTIEPQDAK